MARVIEAPEYYYGETPALFLAGGITGCLNWRAEVIKHLEDLDIAILNPMRSNFDTKNKGMAKEQIHWEFHHLRRADSILFWFPKETDCPISLFELGAWTAQTKRLFVGVDPDYSRRLDIEIQLQLIKPQIMISYTLPDLAFYVRDRWLH